MKRRSFLSVFTGAIAAAAVSARLIREEPKPEVVGRPRSIEDVLNANEEQLAGQIYKKKLNSSPWKQLLPKTDFTGLV